MTYPQPPGGWTDPPPANSYPQPGAPAYPPPYGYPGYGPKASNNGMAIAALVVSCIGVLGLCGYGLGGWIGAIGAILGHVARRQISERGDAGDGMALAGVIIGWIATGLFVLAGIGWGVLWYVASHPDQFDSSTTVMQVLAG